MQLSLERLIPRSHWNRSSLQIASVKEEAFSRKDILERIAKWLAACDEEAWLEEYNRDENRYSAGRGVHLALKRAEKARTMVSKIPAIVESLAAKVTAWESERGIEFIYDGFCRTISSKDTKTSDIRPPAVLETTLTYLLSLVDASDHPFEVVHDFVFDRTRSIRQDLSMQKIVNDQIIHMYEEMVKFHVISHQKLARCCNKSDISSLCYLNMEQLTKCLLSLFDLYYIKQKTNSVNKNEAEFYSLYVLLCLSCKIPKTVDSLSIWFRVLPFHILRSKEMRFARTILRYFRMGNYKCFFSTMAAEASHLQSCLVEPLLNEVRVSAISYINQSGYKLHPCPLLHLARVLMIKEEELESLCHKCGLKVTTDEVGCKFMPTKQSSFSPPKEVIRSYSLLVPDKML